jgi:hypothetical protein
VTSRRFNAERAGVVARRMKRRMSQLRSPDTIPNLVRSERLVPSPVFLLSSVRSGSTLLRVILDSHSAIHAPHEMHLGSLRVTAASWYGEAAIAQLGIQPRDLENLLWDRILHVKLTGVHKSILVDKTPYNTIDWRRVVGSWPSARFIFLMRHPLRIFESLAAARPDMAVGDHYQNVIRYTVALAEARAALPGPSVRYEDLTTDPDGVMRGLCDWLEVAYEPGMLRYGEHDHGTLRRGLGDWGPNISSGVIVPAPPGPLASEIPDELVRSCQLLGYL